MGKLKGDEVKKAGRPRRTETEPVYLQIKVSVDEKRKIQMFANEVTDGNISALVRMLLLGSDDENVEENKIISSAD